MNIEKKNEVLILDQIANYNYDELERNIDNYKKILNNQILLNNTLKNNNSGEIKKETERFVTNRKDIIDKQMRELVTLKNELLYICKENSNLEKEDEELRLLQERGDMKDLANKLGDIENIQREIVDFLEENGIIKFPQH